VSDVKMFTFFSLFPGFYPKRESEGERKRVREKENIREREKYGERVREREKYGEREKERGRER
jgi:hypothetical protein